MSSVNNREKAIVSYDQTTSISKELRPCVDLRLDISKIIERTQLLEDAFYPELHARRLIMTANEKDPTNMVWLRIFPNASSIIYDFVDPKASDLKKCDHLFSRIEGFREHVGHLSLLAAPTFHGKIAMKLVWNLMAIAKIEDLIFGDGSTTAWVILGRFFDGLHKIDIPLKEAVPILCDLWKGSDTARQSIAKKVGPLLERQITQVLQSVENKFTPVHIKICTHSNKQQREEWARYFFETGIKEEFLAPQKAIQYIAKIPLITLPEFYPELAQILDEQFHLKAARLPVDMTLGDLIDSKDASDKSRGDWILEEIFHGAKKHTSALFVHCLETYFSKAPFPKTTYALFMLAKEICQGRTGFFLQLQ